MPGSSCSARSSSCVQAAAPTEKKKDYSAVKFNKKMEPQFEALKEKIFELVDQYARSHQKDPHA